MAAWGLCMPQVGGKVARIRRAAPRTVMTCSPLVVPVAPLVRLCSSRSCVSSPGGGCWTSSKAMTVRRACRPGLGAPAATLGPGFGEASQPGHVQPSPLKSWIALLSRALMAAALLAAAVSGLSCLKCACFTPLKSCRGAASAALNSDSASCSSWLLRCQQGRHSAAAP